jgi:hypothetical protein
MPAESLDDKRFDLEKFKAEQDAKLQSERLQLDREKVAQERIKAQEDSKLQFERLALDQENATQDRVRTEQDSRLQFKRLALDRAKAMAERKFSRNPGLLPAAIAIASMCVSIAGAYYGYVSKQKEVEVNRILKEKELGLADTQKAKEIALAEKQSQHQRCLDEAKYTLDTCKQLQLPSGEITRAFQKLSSDCPEFALTITNFNVAVGTKTPSASEAKACTGYIVANTASEKSFSIEMDQGNNQVLPSNGWKTFTVRVKNERNQPIRGAKVAWRTPDMGEQYTYIGVTDDCGVTGATNLFTSSTTAIKHTQEAQLVEGNPPVGFTQWADIRPVGKPVRFEFTFQ